MSHLTFFDKATREVDSILYLDFNAKNVCIFVFFCTTMQRIYHNLHLSVSDLDCFWTFSLDALGGDKHHGKHIRTLASLWLNLFFCDHIIDNVVCYIVYRSMILAMSAAMSFNNGCMYLDHGLVD